MLYGRLCCAELFNLPWNLCCKKTPFDVRYLRIITAFMPLSPDCPWTEVAHNGDLNGIFKMVVHLSIL